MHEERRKVLAVIPDCHCAMLKEEKRRKKEEGGI